MRLMYTQGTYLFYTPGGHNWFPFSSKSKQLDDGRIQVLRYGAWVTSAGFADFYVVESTSPSFEGDFMNLSLYLMFKVTFGCLCLSNRQIFRNNNDNNNISKAPFPKGPKALFTRLKIHITKRQRT